jgi:DNA polymerase III sliding clamp (beta) subunit (PCNA family)
MRATTTRQSLLSALQVLAPALSRSNPYGSQVCLISASEETLSLRAHSLEWDATCSLPCGAAIPGRATVPAAFLTSLPWAALGDTVSISASETAVSIASGMAEYTVPMPQAAFPDIPGGARHIASVPGRDLADALLLGCACSRPLSSSILPHGHTPSEDDRDGVWLSIADGVLTIRSTDKTRASFASLPAPSTTALSAALPTHSALSAAKAARQADTVRILAPKGDRPSVVVLEAGPASIAVRALSLLPPDPEPLLGRAGAPCASASAQDLASALRAASAVAGTTPLVPVTLSLSGRELSVETALPSGSARCRVPLADGQAAPQTATANARALLSLAAPLGEAQISLSLGPGPITLRASVRGISYTAFLAPLAPAAGAERPEPREPARAAAP